MPHILIADDHEVVRRGLKDVLLDELDDVSFGEAGSADELFALLDVSAWDLLILDIVMPGSHVVDVLKHVKQRRKDLPVLILTAVTEDQYVNQTLSAGADGYITKRYAVDELATAVRALLRGDRYLSQEAIRAVAGRLAGDAPLQPHDRLSPRELHVFLLIARGQTVKETAATLGVSDKTVATYMARIKDKTGLQSYVEIARYALHHHLVT